LSKYTLFSIFVAASRAIYIRVVFLLT